MLLQNGKFLREKVVNVFSREHGLERTNLAWNTNIPNSFDLEFLYI